MININDTYKSQTLAPLMSPLSDASRVVTEAEVEKMGVLDDTGAMTEDFNVGDQFDDPDVVDKRGNLNESESRVFGGRVRVKRLRLCDKSMREYIPCLDNVEVIRRLKSTKKGESLRGIVRRRA